MGNRWIAFLTRRKWFVIAFWIILLGMTLPLALNVTKHLTANGFNRPGTNATWATNQLSRLHPAKAPEPLLITGVPFHQLTILAHQEHIASETLHPISRGQVLYLPAPKTSLAQVHAFTHIIQQHHGQWQDVTQDTAGKTVSHDSSKTLALSGILALPFLAVLLFFVYGSLAAIALPLIIAAMGSELALAVVSVIETHIQLSVFLTDIVSFLALGVGIDYALFISNRFRLALARGENVPHAVHESMRHAGRSVLYSGIAVALAVAALLLGGDAYWRGLALGGAIAIFSVLLATHSLLPAIMSVMGKHINWGSLKRVPEFGFWRRVGDFVTNKPGLSIIVSVVLLLPLALFGPQIRMQTPANLASMLPVNSPIRQAIHKEQQLLGPGSIAPLAVVIDLPSSLSQPLSWTQISHLTQHLRSLPGVKSVASPTQVGLTSQQLAFLFQHPSLQSEPLKTALSNFTAPDSSHLVVLYVTATTGPDNPKTSDLVHRINQNLPKWLPKGTKAGVGGQVPILRSFNQLTHARLSAIIATALAVALIVLALATGSVVQAVLGVLFDALVALATAGLLVLVVQQGRFGFEAQPLDSSITPLIFVLLFGLSMDYEVILLHRIQEPLKEGKPVRQAVRHGISTTGSMITGAGMIMVVVFLALLISPLQVMKTLAIGLSFAVLIDTWVVRSLLVPATITLLNTKAYWPWHCSKTVPTDQEPRTLPGQYQEEEQ
ncbi:MMPL family transporter [Sulfobacillus thermosulfidooxidans]|uniref:MMPL family transporter n=1 Tax=Sulfobacillus thermosulfidooxidans TaxID=28034 RepID=UPI0003F89054|nr:MMPL family transporter [Sulfobacillus thermosulfidooxidans]